MDLFRRVIWMGLLFWGLSQAATFQMKKQLVRCEDRSSLKVPISESLDTGLQNGKTRRESPPDTSSEESHHGLHDCDQKLSISIRINSGVQSDISPQYIVVDSVYDPWTGHNVKLYNPLVVRLRQRPVLLAYPLKHIFSVNNKPFEEITHRDVAATDADCSASSKTISLCSSQPKSKVQAGFCCTCAGGETEDHVQIRGGQDCSGENTHTSIHCLKFDPLWYSVNSLGAPYVIDSLSVGVYMDYEPGEKSWVSGGPPGKRHWTSMTGQHDLAIGTDNRTAWGQNKKVHATYTDINMRVSNPPLDDTREYLLIPEPITGTTPLQPMQSQKQLKGGVNEYLVFDREMYQPAGDTCDTIGVSQAAFVNQDSRCKQAPQSCLKNQPANFWLEDKEKQKLGRNGTYFLGSRGSLATPSFVEREGEADKKYLMFNYRHPHTSHLYLEVNADKVTLIRTGSHGVLLETQVRSESTQTELRALVFNSGLASALFSLTFTACSALSVHPQIHELTVGPHQAHWVIVTLPPWGRSSAALNGTCLGMVDLVNSDRVLVARRTMPVNAMDHCYCIGHCTCKCATSREQSCQPLDQATYREAGFRGVVPQAIHRQRISPNAAQVAEIAFIVVFLLFVMGLLKMLTGVFLSVEVGQFGLSLFRDPEWPDTRGRQMSVWREMALNAFFLFYIPFLPLHLALSEIQQRQKLTAQYQQLGPGSPVKRALSAVKRPKRPPPPLPSLSPLDSSVQGSPRRDKLDRDAIIRQFRSQKKGLQREAEFTQAGTGGAETSTQDDSTRDPETSVLDVLEEKDRDFMAHITEGGIAVFYRFDQSDIHLRRPGDRFCLCGHLRQVDQVFKFTLGPHLTQLYENINGEARPLLTPLPINPKFFQRSLTLTEVLQRITQEPSTPCLNYAFDKFFDRSQSP